MRDELKTTMIVLVCQGDVNASDRLKSDSVDRLEQAIVELKTIFPDEQKNIICSNSPQSMQTAEVLQTALEAELFPRPIFAQLSYKSLNDDVNNIVLHADRGALNLVIVPKDIFHEIVESYSLRKYERFLEMKDDPNGGDFVIFDDLEEMLHEFHFIPGQQTGQ